MCEETTTVREANLHRGVAVGREAEEYDTRRDYPKAYLYYLSSIKLLLAAAHSEDLEESQRREVIDRAQKYVVRAQVLSRAPGLLQADQTQGATGSFRVHRRSKASMPRHFMSARELQESQEDHLTGSPLVARQRDPTALYLVSAVSACVSCAGDDEVAPESALNLGPGASVTAHNPGLWARARRTLGLGGSEFLRSFDVASGGGVDSMRGAGRSKSVFMVTKDKRYIVKSLSGDDHRTLAAITAQYLRHVAPGGTSTLLVRILCHFRLALSSPPVDGGTPVAWEFVVMENLFPDDRSQVSEVYDLKGSTYKRQASEQEKLRPDCVMKDVDLLNGLKGRTRFSVSPAKQALIVRALEADADFLESCGVMDYSLLIAVVKRGPVSPTRPPCRKRPLWASSSFRQDDGGTAAADPEEILYLGIVDFLQPFNLAKKVEKGLKALVTGGTEEISSTDPATYCLRYKRFLGRVFCPGVTGDPSSRAPCCATRRRETLTGHSLVCSFTKS